MHTMFWCTSDPNSAWCGQPNQDAARRPMIEGVYRLRRGKVKTLFCVRLKRIKFGLHRYTLWLKILSICLRVHMFCGAHPIHIRLGWSNRMRRRRWLMIEGMSATDSDAVRLKSRLYWHLHQFNRDVLRGRLSASPRFSVKFIKCLFHVMLSRTEFWSAQKPNYRRRHRL